MRYQGSSDYRMVGEDDTKSDFFVISSLKRSSLFETERKKQSENWKKNSSAFMFGCPCTSEVIVTPGFRGHYDPWPGLDVRKV